MKEPPSHEKDQYTDCSSHGQTRVPVETAFRDQFVYGHDKMGDRVDVVKPVQGDFPIGRHPAEHRRGINRRREEHAELKSETQNASRIPDDRVQRCEKESEPQRKQGNRH